VIYADILISCSLAAVLEYIYTALLHVVFILRNNINISL
jgi:hypothetical protein